MTSSNKLFQRGKHFVTVVEIVDKDQASGTRKAFAIIHEPTGVQCALTSLLAAAIRTTVLMDEAAEKAIADPDDGEGENMPPAGGFGGGFGGLL